MANRSRNIIAVIATDKKHLAGGKAQTFLADSTEQCQKLAQEIALAVQGEVASLSIGVYMVLDT
ncbi:capping complex subunit for YIEGIA [Tumebacillus lipolyticus]|uniref:Uncharacterized protein n=1 Tax=Tumebacillus lipolyticus TaxID=1280370 RepID=A0ABW4ZUD0_9BACL